MKEHHDSTWGGKRNGAGRKAKFADPVVLGFTVERELAASLDSLVASTGKSRSELLTCALQEFLSANEMQVASKTE